MNRKASWRGVAKALDQLTEEELTALIDNAGELKMFASGLVARSSENTYFTWISDKDVPKKLAATTVKWRKLAAELDYTGPVAWRVREGFTLKTHAPKAGPCYKEFEYLKDWSLRNDEPTKSMIVFWIPRLLEGSTGKNVAEQMALLGHLRERLGLPKHHLTSHGSVALLSGLILANFKRNGERVPLNSYWAGTDTLSSDGRRLILGRFGGEGLDCGGRDWDGDGRGGLGCFPLGVEELGY